MVHGFIAQCAQVFSPDFCARHAAHTINIHHSFLPAFEGTPVEMRSVHSTFQLSAVEFVTGSMLPVYWSLGTCVVLKLLGYLFCGIALQVIEWVFKGKTSTLCGWKCMLRDTYA